MIARPFRPSPADLSSNSRLLRSGQIVDGTYQLLEKIASGGFGDVWLARKMRGGDEQIALKVLRDEHREDRRLLERFAREASLLTLLVHPAIAGAVGFRADSNLAYLAMEFVPGRPLAEAIAERAREARIFTDEEAGLLASSIISAVGFANERGVVHRDLQPRNVLVEGEGERLRAKVIDFGIAKILGQEATRATTEGRIMGTPIYLTPEQIQGSNVEQTADVFAIAVLMYEILTLKHPWLRAEDGRLLSVAELKPRSDRMLLLVKVPQRILSAPRPKVSEARPCPEAVDAVIARALASNPADRHRTVAEFFEEFSHSMDLWGHTTTLRRIAWNEDTPVVEETRSETQINDTRTVPAPSRVSVEAPPAPTRVVVEAPATSRLVMPALLALLVGTAVAVIAVGLGAESPQPTPPAQAPPSIEAIGGSAPPEAEAPKPRPEEATASAPAPESKPDLPPPGLRPKRPRREAAPHAATNPAPRARSDLVDVERLLAAARAHPGDGKLLRELADQVIQAAGRLDDPDRAAAIKRRAAASAMVFELAGLEGCVRDLESRP
jgi:serine/threonine protein kinase